MYQTVITFEHVWQLTPMTIYSKERVISTGVQNIVVDGVSITLPAPIRDMHEKEFAK